VGVLKENVSNEKKPILLLDIDTIADLCLSSDISIDVTLHTSMQKIIRDV